jgi:hypothetical protein
MPVMIMFILIMLGFGAVVVGTIHAALRNSALKMNEQTHIYAYNHIPQQMNNANSFLYMLLTDTEITEILERNKSAAAGYGVVDDVQTLQQKLERISALSLSIELNNDVSYVSYATSIIVDAQSRLYETATGPFRVSNVILKNDPIQDEGWYQSLLRREKNTVCWLEQD